MALAKLNLNPTRRTLRQFGMIGLLAFPLLSLLVRYQVGFFRHLPDGAVAPATWALLGLGAYCGFFAAIAPKAIRPLYVLMSVMFYPIGLVVFPLAMALMYYGVLTPMALVFKLVGRDTMNRRFDAAAATYWVPRKLPAGAKRYFRQF